jgi:SnoaL-like domain
MPRCVSRVLAVEGGPLRGHEGIRIWWEGILGAFPDFKLEVLSILGVDDVTMVQAHARGRDQENGAVLDDSIWVAARWRNGKVVWWQSCMSEEEALEAAGLED